MEIFSRIKENNLSRHKCTFSPLYSNRNDTITEYALHKAKQKSEIASKVKCPLHNDSNIMALPSNKNSLLLNKINLSIKTVQIANLWKPPIGSRILSDYCKDSKARQREKRIINRCYRNIYRRVLPHSITLSIKSPKDAREGSSIRQSKDYHELPRPNTSTSLKGCKIFQNQLILKRFIDK